MEFTLIALLSMVVLCRGSSIGRSPDQNQHQQQQHQQLELAVQGLDNELASDPQGLSQLDQQRAYKSFIANPTQNNVIQESLILINNMFIMLLLY